MTIQQLQYILEVQRTGSVSRAAKKLFVSQSGISTCIAGIEAELGFAVFERTRQGMIPTPRGMHVLEHAAKICMSYSDMMGQSTGKRRRICIGGNASAPFVDAFVELIKENQSGMICSFVCKVISVLMRLFPWLQREIWIWEC